MDTKTLKTLLGGIAIGAVAGFGISALMKKKADAPKSTSLPPLPSLPPTANTVGVDGEEEFNATGVMAGEGRGGRGGSSVPKYVESIVNVLDSINENSTNSGIFQNSKKSGITLTIKMVLSSLPAYTSGIPKYVTAILNILNSINENSIISGIFQNVHRSQIDAAIKQVALSKYTSIPKYLHPILNISSAINENSVNSGIFKNTHRSQIDAMIKQLRSSL